MPSVALECAFPLASLSGGEEGACCVGWLLEWCQQVPSKESQAGWVSQRPLCLTLLLRHGCPCRGTQPHILSSPPQVLRRRQSGEDSSRAAGVFPAPCTAVVPCDALSSVCHEPQVGLGLTLLVIAHSQLFGCFPGDPPPILVQDWASFLGCHTLRPPGNAQGLYLVADLLVDLVQVFWFTTFSTWASVSLPLWFPVL